MNTTAQDIMDDLHNESDKNTDRVKKIIANTDEYNALALKKHHEYVMDESKTQMRSEIAELAEIMTDAAQHLGGSHPGLKGFMHALIYRQVRAISAYSLKVASHVPDEMFDTNPWTITFRRLREYVSMTIPKQNPSSDDILTFVKTLPV